MKIQEQKKKKKRGEKREVLCLEISGAKYEGDRKTLLGEWQICDKEVSV